MFDLNSNTRIVFDGDNLSYLKDETCPRCNTTLSEILRTGVVGCVNCYKTFEKDIISKIMQIHGSVNHMGKISSKHFSKIKIKEKIKQLEIEKENAARQENFIVAEALKNQIEKLKGELDGERL